MTARFLALCETPAGPGAFGRHYHEIHLPPGRRLPGLRRYAVSRDVAAVRGAPYYLLAELDWDTKNGLRAAFAPPQGPRHRRRRGTPRRTHPGTQHDLHHGRRPGCLLIPRHPNRRAAARMG